MVDYHGLTHSQSRIWHVEQSHPGTSMWNNAGTLKIRGTLDFDLLEQAVQGFVRRNESARLRIHLQDGEPLQYVAPFHPVHVDRFDFSSMGVAGLYEWDVRQTQAPLSILDSPLVYFALARTAPDEGYLYAKTHHIISDGVSFVVLANEIMETYDCLLSGVEPRLPKPISYLDFVEEERRYIASDRYARDEAYWLDRFSELPEPTVLKPRTADYFSTKAKRKACLLPADLSQEIRAFCSENRVSVFVLLLAAFGVYLNRVLNRSDLVVSAPVSNRTFAGSADRFGMYVSTVPVRLSVDDEKTFLDFVGEVSDEWFSILKHQRYPYDLLMKRIHQEHADLDRIYDLSLSYQVGTFEKGKRNFSYEGRWHFSGHQASSLNIHWNDREDDGRFVLDYDYLHPLFAAKEVDFIHEHLCNLLMDAIAHPLKRLHEIDMLSADETRKVVHGFNAIDTVPIETDLVTLWRLRMFLSPDSSALVYHDRTWSVSEVDDASDALAHSLVECGVCPGDVVALMLPRSDAYFIAMLGILKAGAAFMPVDPALPEERVHYMLSEAQSHIALRWRGELCGWEGALPEGVATVLYEDALDSAGDRSKVDIIPDRHGAAYIIYTSGSTGVPKGVVIEHRSIAHFVRSLQIEWSRSDGGRMLAVGPISFDISVMEAAIGFFTDRTLVVADDHEAGYPESLCGLVIAQQVDLMMVTPGRMEMMLSSPTAGQALGGFREIGLGADVLPLELLKRIRLLTSSSITNFYGPTEATIASTCCDVTEAATVNIGAPMDGVHIYILDPHGNPLPIGIPGEIHIGGAGLARGYVARDELTDERFVTLPLFPGERLYRTGDLGRWYPRGEIEFLGRMDQQVKIRGYRVELGEIQNRLLQIEGMRSAAVICREDDGRRYLCGYLVGDHVPTMPLVKAHLARSLPFYMVPAYLMELDELPLTISGKLDHRRLPEPCESLMASTPPETATEIRLAGLWCDILHVASVGREDHFLEMGGDSLSIVRMVGEVGDTFDVDIRLEDVYREPTLTAVAECIDRAETGYRRPIRPVPARRYQPTTPTQRQMFLASQRDPDSVAYNVPALFVFEGELDDRRLSEALERLIELHAALRTSIHLREGDIVQQVHRSFETPFRSVHIPDADIADSAGSFILPFDLAQAPLVRLTALHSDTRTALLFDFHHAVCDQMGFEAAMADFERIYRGDIPAASPVDYKDCAVWMERRAGSESMECHRTFWEEALAEEIPLLDLPTERVRSGRRDGGVCLRTIPNAQLGTFRRFMEERRSTAVGGIMTAFGLVLSRMASQERVSIGMPVSGRTQTAMQHVVGAFINLLPIGCLFEDAMTIDDCHHRIERTLAGALSHQEYPFEEMVKTVQTRDPLRNPLFDVMFVFGKGQVSLDLGRLRSQAQAMRTGTSKLDLTLFVYETGEGFECRLEYDADLFSEMCVTRILDRLSYTVQTLFADPGRRLREAGVLPPEELRLITESFSATDRPYLQSTLSSWIQELAVRRPYDEAVVASDGRLDFQTLGSRVEHIAQALCAAGISKGSIIALMMRRTVDLLPAILGIMEAGAAYVPIDPDFPEARVTFMLEDCGADLLLCDIASLPRNGQTPFAHVRYIEDILEGSAFAGADERPAVGPGDLAYVIYTSGSTGTPKASLLTCGGVANLREAMGRSIGYDPSWTAVSVTTMSFDIFMADALLPLTYGCRVVLADEEELRQPLLLARLIEREQVDFLQTTPSRMQIMVDDADFAAAARRLRTVVMAGEKPALELVRTCKSLMPSARLKNGYGPTEVTVYTSFQELSDCDHVSIGKPIDNTHVYLLDSEARPVPLGTWGEAYISGAGVSLGYLGRPDLTAERFLLDPFRPGLIMYRSGDICRFDENGELFIAGRIDHQVKIRGQRIELGEVEACLRGCEGVHEAVVTVSGEAERKRLVAFYVPKGCSEATCLREQMVSRLPVYMVPTRFIVMDHMPMTANGKVDRSQLPDPDEYGVDQGAGAHPHRSVSRKLSTDERRFLKTVAKVLGVDEVGMEDDIFSLGADSLAIISLQSKLIRYGESVRTQDFYDSPTLGDLFLKIERDDPGSGDSMVTSPTAGNAGTTVAAAESLLSLNRVVAADTVSPGASLDRAVVTGATGFLGAHLVAALLAGGAGEISCLVRADDGKQARARLERTFMGYGLGVLPARVQAVPADISSDLAVCKSHLIGTTAIFHCAALTEHVGRRDDYEKSNVEGTRHIIELAESLDAALMHMSTVSIAGWGGSSFDERSYYTGQNVDDNEYARSKFLAEGLVLDAFGRGLAGRIFRVGNLTGRLRDGVFQHDVSRNAFAMRLAAFISLGCYPSGWDGTVELTPVDLCAQAIVSLSGSAGDTRALHVRSEHQVTLDEITALMGSAGYDLEAVPSDVFAARALAGAEVDFSRTFGVVRDLVERPSGRPTSVSSQITEDLLRAGGFVWPVPDGRYMCLYLSAIMEAIGSGTSVASKKEGSDVA